jgi:manganese/zinc/iron transport system substrate-binding protein
VGTLPSRAQEEDPRLKVIATTTQIADLVTILAGERVELTALMGPGVDPHLYKASEADIQAMNQAQAVFYNGLHLEGQLDEIFAALGERDILTYAVADPVEQAGFLFEVEAGVYDPHFWFDPRNWQLAAQGLAETLAALDPQNADFYLANAEAYITDLEALYNWGVEAMAGVPADQRVLITSHDAFRYFGDAFGWEVRGLQGISTQDEAGVADIQAIADLVSERQIPVLFVESSVPPDAIEAVQQAVLSRGFEVGLGQRELYSDAMGSEGTFADSYTGMLAENILTILQSFGAEIPAWPEGLEPVPPADLFAQDQ